MAARLDKAASIALVLGAGALVVAAVATIVSEPDKRVKHRPPVNDANRPPGTRDVPRAPRESLTHEVTTARDALDFVGDTLAAKAIRDGRPLVFVVGNTIDSKSLRSWNTFVHAFSLGFKSSPTHLAEVTSSDWKKGEVLVGMIYQQGNGIWTATRPTPDLIFQDVSDPQHSISQALRLSGFLKKVLADTEEPSAFTEITPEQARMVREGSTVSEAIASTR